MAIDPDATSGRTVVASEPSYGSKPMRLRVGELARRTGLTVRSLYERGANEPDLRSGSGVDEKLFGYVRAALEEINREALPN